MSDPISQKSTKTPKQKTGPISARGAPLPDGSPSPFMPRPTAPGKHHPAPRVEPLHGLERQIHVRLIRRDARRIMNPPPVAIASVQQDQMAAPPLIRPLGIADLGADGNDRQRIGVE